MERITSTHLYREKALYIEQKERLQDAIMQAEDRDLETLREYEALECDASVDDATIDRAYAEYEQASDFYHLLMDKRDAVDNIISLLDRLIDEVEFLETY